MAENTKISVPPDLLEQWRTAPEYTTGFSGRVEMVSMRLQRLQEIADQAAQYGADQELEACCEVLARELICDGKHVATDLRAARRLKPPSLVEEAIKEINLMEGAMYSADLGCDFTATRAALERLQELENND